MDITPSLAAELDDSLAADLDDNGRLGLVKRYLEGDHDLPYMPKTAKREYKALAERSRPNWLPLVPDEFNKGLAVDGIRLPRVQENHPVWRYWQINGLDARQTIAHRGALEYGVSYVLVLPGAEKDRPVIQPLSPLRSLALYEDDDDEFPRIALQRLGTYAEGDKTRQLLAVYDDIHRVVFSRADDGGPARIESTEEHGMGVVPFVRFRERLGTESCGLVRPFKTYQDRINDVAFNIAMALQYASFRQRWATGLAIPEDDEGNPVEPFQSAVDRLWVSTSDSTKFGDFAQTDISGHQAEYKAAVASLAAAAQIDADLFAGNMTNVTGAALVARRYRTLRKLSEYQLLFGEAWEQVFQLAATAAGTEAPDDLAEVQWRDTSGEEMLAKVQALAELANNLNVPARALWEEIPGMTDAKVKRWEEFAEADPLLALTEEIKRQGTAPAAASDAPTDDEADTELITKADADTFSTLVRSGVEQESAARKVGIDGLEFTGGTPVTMRPPGE